MDEQDVALIGSQRTPVFDEKEVAIIANFLDIPKKYVRVVANLAGMKMAERFTIGSDEDDPELIDTVLELSNEDPGRPGSFFRPLEATREGT